MKTKKILIIILASFVLECIIITPLRGFSIALAATLSLPLYVGLTYFLLAKYKESLKPWLLGLLMVVGTLPTNILHVFYFMDTLLSFPIWIYELLGVYLGYSCFISKYKFIRIAIVVIAIGVSVLGYYYYDCWREYIRGLDYFEHINCR